MLKSYILISSSTITFRDGGLNEIITQNKIFRVGCNQMFMASLKGWETHWEHIRVWQENDLKTR